MNMVGKKLTLTFAAGCVALLLAGPACAADASPWVEDNYSGIRLIAGANKGGAESLRAGIEIKMLPGWHTYWRYPGDSGVPPRFSFAGSDNLASAKVLYPAPHAFTDETGTTIGYKGDVILPLDVFPRQPGKPVTLRAKVDYAVCEKLCVPVEAKIELTIPPTDGADNPELEFGGSARAQANFRGASRTDRSSVPVTTRSSRWSSSISPRPAESRSNCSSRGRARNGRCPSPSRRKAHRPATSISVLNSMGCRPASIPRAISNSLSRSSATAMRPRSRLISTNPRLALFCAS